MAEDGGEAGVVSRVQRRRRRSVWSRLRGMLLWVVAMVVLTGFLAGGVLYLAYEWRVQLLNAALAEFAAPFRVEVGGIDFLGDGRVMMRDLRAGLPEDEVDRIRVPVAELTYRRTGRWEWAVETLRVREPVVTVDDEVMDALAARGWGGLGSGNGESADAVA
ncbi:MAG: hypothetical protein AAF591_22820, partial [Verrucomicrobiota bacterium]